MYTLTMQHKSRALSCIIVIAAALAGCAPNSATENGTQAADGDYEAAVEEWYARRIAGLTAPDGWLALTGLFWLESGENSFGAADTNDLVFPDSTLPAYLGSFYLSGDSVTARLDPASGVAHTGARTRTFGVLSDAYEEPTRFERGSLHWYVINREGRLGVRLRDTTAAARVQFTGTERYPLRPEWRITGRFVAHEAPREMVVPTELNTTAVLTTPGAVEFELGGDTHRLDVAGESGAERLWIIFADPTNTTSTYPAGRYLYIDAPDEAGNVVIDFNMSYSPPCAFSVYATCPFPPPQNRLTVAVEAGEKRYTGLINGRT